MLETIKKQIQEEAKKIEQEIWDIAVFIHEHPELGLQEFQAVAKLTKILEAHGFTIEREVAGLETAFRAAYVLNGNTSPTIAFLAEYDALPEVGHACGHNIIGAASVGAGIVLSKIQALQGRIVILGTPAEEVIGGKIPMVKQGVFDDIDAALMVHPGDKDLKRRYNLAAIPVNVEFRGKPAHAAARPYEGLNALDAMVLLFTNIGLLRQQLKDDVRIHGIITHGGTAVNITPDYTRGEFLVRASELSRACETLEKFKSCVRGAAVATGTTEHIEVDGDNIYEPLMTNNTIMNLYADNMKRLGVEVEDQSLAELGGSSDIGNVSQVVPAIHPTLGIAEKGQEIAGHSYEFAQAAKSERGKIGMIRGLQALAMCGADLLGDPRILKAAKEEFQKSTIKR